MCIIHLGYLDEYSKENVTIFLAQFGVHILRGLPSIAGLNVFETQTENAEKRCLLCFGKYSDVHLETRREALSQIWQKRYSPIEIKERMEWWEKSALISRDNILEDVQFWLSFIPQFILKFKTMGLCYCSMSNEPSENIEYVSAKDINQEFLLNMQYQTFYVIS